MHLIRKSDMDVVTIVLEDLNIFAYDKFREHDLRFNSIFEYFDTSSAPGLPC